MAYRAGDVTTAVPLSNTLIYGDSGSGKSTWGAQCPKPFVMLTEYQARNAIAVANPEAFIEPVEDHSKFMAVLAAMKRGTQKTSKTGQPLLLFRLGSETYAIQTVVIDSLTDIHERLVKKIRYTDGKRIGEPNWTKIGDQMRAILHDLRTLPVNICCICLLGITEKEKEPTKTHPDLYGKLKYRVGQFFESVGLVRKFADPDGKVQHAIDWQLPEGFVTKMPATRMGFPPRTFNDMDRPGMTTMGSILLYLYPDANVSCEECDSADFVGCHLARASVSDSQAEESVAA